MDKNSLKREYIERQVIPWLLAHIQMRGVGLQVFVAIQGALMYAHSSTHSLPIVILGLVMCLSFISWDIRNRDVFGRLHKLASDHCDSFVFGLGIDGLPLDGLHTQAIKTLSKSRNFSAFGSHTAAIRLIVSAAIFCWGLFVFRHFQHSTALVQLFRTNEKKVQTTGVKIEPQAKKNESITSGSTKRKYAKNTVCPIESNSANLRDTSKGRGQN